MKITKVLEHKLKGERSISSRKPLLIENRLFVLFIFDKGGRSQSKVQCVDTSTFAVNWEYDYPFVINNLLMSPNRTVLCCCMDGKIIELSPSEGSVLEIHALSLERNGQTSELAGQKLVVGGVQGSTLAVCYDYEQKEITWTFDTGGHSYNPLVNEDKVFICTEKNINCLDLATGKQLWSAKEESTYLFNPMQFHDLIIVGGHGLLNLYAKENGDLVHQIKTGMEREAIREIISVDDKIYFGDSAGKMYCYQLEVEKNSSGKTVVNSTQTWEILTGGGIESTPAFYNENVLIVNDDNKLLCLAGDTGEQRWKFNTKGEAGISGITLDNDLIYVSVGKGNVYQLRED